MPRQFVHHGHWSSDSLLEIVSTSGLYNLREFGENQSPGTKTVTENETYKETIDVLVEKEKSEL